MGRFKIGDKVRITHDGSIVHGKDSYNIPNFNAAMRDELGKVSTIVEECRYGYTLRGLPWVWHASWLSHYALSCKEDMEALYG